MATEFTVILQDKPGTLARLGAVLGDARVNRPWRAAHAFVEKRPVNFGKFRT